MYEDNSVWWMELDHQYGTAQGRRVIRTEKEIPPYQAPAGTLARMMANAVGEGAPPVALWTPKAGVQVGF